VVSPKTNQFDKLLSEGTEIMNLNNKAIMQNNTQIIKKFNIINYIKSFFLIN
jgi:hypothetical protein